MVPCFYFYSLYAKLVTYLNSRRRFTMKQNAYLSIISGACLWGLIALFFKYLSACGFSPLQVVTLRVLFAALLMTVIIAKVDPALFKIRWRDSWLFIGTGLLSLVFLTTAILGPSKAALFPLPYFYYIRRRFL